MGVEINFLVVISVGFLQLGQVFLSAEKKFINKITGIHIGDVVTMSTIAPIMNPRNPPSGEESSLVKPESLLACGDGGDSLIIPVGNVT